MASEYCRLYDLLHSDGDLWKVAEVAVIIAALGVKYEDPSTTNHAARLEWATAVLDDAPAWVKANKVKVLENVTVRNAGHAAADADVQFVINGLVPV